ncbi:MAG: MotA/TolQ/ExbB proton channel family protein [Deltaproteobacteria bacterium]|nr:MotA/TolQ/ExbB proton channel family protein [Deltaproteobacteria bacterium]
MQHEPNLTTELFHLPLFNPEWVLWLLLSISFISVAVMLERWFFFRRRRHDIDDVQRRLEALLEVGDLAAAEAYLASFDSLEANVARRGVEKLADGATAVEEILGGAEAVERLRFSRGLGFLASVGSNAPFIGLFGTVLGVIRAFQDLASDVGNASGSVMSGIAEALVATAVGLLVAIPAVIAYNALSGRVRAMSAQSRLLSSTILYQLKRAGV